MIKPLPNQEESTTNQNQTELKERLSFYFSFNKAGKTNNLNRIKQ